MEKLSDPQVVNICLIGGSGRSGTTILKEIFVRHPDVAFIPEWRFSIDPDGAIDFFNTFSAGWSPYLFDVKLRRLERLLKDIGRRNRLYTYLRRVPGYTRLTRKIPYKLVSRYSHLSIADDCPNYFELVDQLIEQLLDFRYRGTWAGADFLQEASMSYGSPVKMDELACILGGFIRQVAWSIVQHQNARHYVEDNTWNILWFDKLLQLMPEAKLVHVYRDPRDVVASYTKRSWTPSDPVQAAKFYQDIMERWWMVRQNVPQHSFKEISLEDLVANPKPVLENICAFWGIEWSEALLTTDLSRSNSGRWRRDLTGQQQEQICAILVEQLARLGYKDE